MRLVRGYGLSDREAEAIAERLKELGFLDEERYTSAFLRSKERAGWGRHKIAAAMRAKQISSSAIERALDSIAPSSDRLRELLSRKMLSTKAKDHYQMRDKLIRFALSRGFDYEVVRPIVESLISSDQR